MTRLAVALSAALALVVAPRAAPARRKSRRPIAAAGVVSPVSATAPAPGTAAAGAASLLPAAARTYQRSYDAEAAGRVAEALHALNELPPDEQASYLARLRRGWLLYLEGRHAESVTAYRQAIAAARGSVEARVGCLLPLIALRDWAEVEAGARAALQLDAANYLAGVRLAFAVYNLGRFSEAEGLYRRVLAQYPSDGVARAGLGWSLLKQGKRSEARQQFLEASRAAPLAPAVVDGLAQAAG